MPILGKAMRKGRFNVTWFDAGLEPKEAPDPAFPDGVELDASKGLRPACKVMLTYPAPRVGAYGIFCKKCLTSLLVTTAGRADDPRSITIPCKRKHLD